jgi:hypothetical protein
MPAKSKPATSSRRRWLMVVCRDYNALGEPRSRSTTARRAA